MIAWVAAAVFAASPLPPCGDLAQCVVRLPADAPAELRAALEGMGLQLGEPGEVAALKSPGRDRAFAIEASLEGRQARVRVRSLHRGPEVYGEATQTVAATGPAFAGRARTVAFRVAALGAFADLEGRINEALGQGVRRLRFSIRVNGLDQGARQQVTERTLACLKSRLDLVGPVTQAAESSGYLEEEVEYAPGKGEPRDPLEHHVAWVKDALLSGPRAACTVQGTPLGRYAVRVSGDALNRAVVIAFDR